MVGRKPSPFAPKRKTALKGRGTARPKKAPAYEEENEEISSAPSQKPKKTPAPRRGIKPSAPQEQLSAEDKKKMRQRRQRRRTVVRILVLVLVLALAAAVWVHWDVLAPDKLWASIQDMVGGGVGSYPVDLTGTNARRLEQVNNYTVVLTDSHLTYYNASGAEVSRYGCSYADALVRTEGNYVLVAEQGAYRLHMTTRSETVLELTTEQKIHAVALNAKGQLAVLTDGPQGYAVQITVYDKKGKTLYTRKSNRTITDVALSHDGTTLTAVSVEAVDGTLNTRLEVFSLSSSSADAMCAYQADDTLLYRAVYLSDGTLVAVGEQEVILMNTADGGVSVYAPEGMYMLGYAMGGDTVALAMRAYGDTAGGVTVVLSSGGAEQCRAAFGGEFRHLSGCDGRYALLTDSAVSALTADGVVTTVSVQADGRQVIYAEGHLVVMGLNRLESYPVGG